MRRQRGFTLLEIILAFALMSVGLGILVAILSGGLAQVRTAGDATEATLHAQSLLDQLGVLEPIEPGREQGEFDRGRYRWDLEITEAEGKVRIGGEYALADAAKAHADMESRRTTGKLVLIP